MATWTTISAALVVAGKPVTASLMNALRENPQAIAEGASGAPRNQLGSLAELVAGGSVRAVGPSLTVSSGTTLELVCQLPFIQRGTIRVYAEHRVIAGSMSSDLEISIIRGQVTTLLGTWNTTSTSFVARTLDATVKPGDVITISHKAIGAGSPVSEVQSPFFSTDGGDLWPTYSASTHVVNNSV